MLGLLVRGYQLFLSPVLPPSCRHLPTCSEYALEALARNITYRSRYGADLDENRFIVNYTLKLW